jgi:hypothetical protein
MMVLQTLCNEPWCWPPEQARKITDDQFYYLFVKPSRRKESRKRGGSVNNGRMPTKGEYVAGGVALGGNAEDFEKSYDEWVKTQKVDDDGEGNHGTGG